MSDRIAVFRLGRLQQFGKPLEIYRSPANRFVADFIGESNLIKSQVESVSEGRIDLRVGEEHMTASLGDIRPASGQEVFVAIRPEKLLIATEKEMPAQALTGVMTQVIYIGTDTRYIVTLPSGVPIAVRVQNGCGRDLEEFKRGDRVHISWAVEDARTLLA